MIISGMLNAAAGMVGFILSPVLQSLLDAGGLTVTLEAMIGIAALLVPVIFVVTSRDKASVEIVQESADTSVLSLLREAFGNRTFRLLLAGFTTCGFHMVIIESHLFSQFVLYGISEKNASWAYSVYGIATIVGALLSGFLCVRVPKGSCWGFTTDSGRRGC